MTNIQPKRDYQPSTDLEVLHREMSQRNRADRDRIQATVRKKLARIKAEEEVRERWNRFTEEEKQARVDKLEELCKELIDRHPDYKAFKTAQVTVTDGVVKIHWNGSDPEKVTGWQMVDKSGPVEDIPLMIKRCNDRLLNLKREDEI